VAVKKKTELPPLSAREHEQLQELIPEFINQCRHVRSSRLEAGKLASQLKPLYCRAGRKGGWRRFVEKECGQKLRTVDEWILDYERSIGIRQPPEQIRESLEEVVGQHFFFRGSLEAQVPQNDLTNLLPAELRSRW
jgi:hypothetical protein